MGERASDAADSDEQKSVLFGDGAKLDAPLTLWTIPGEKSVPYLYAITIYSFNVVNAV
jgi:hypothetical protein